MSSWRPTAALARALVVGTGGTALAVLLGAPGVLVLVAPLLVLAALGVLHRPTSAPAARTQVDAGVLHEGQGTRVRLWLADDGDVEHVARAAVPAPHVALRPAGGQVSGLVVPGRRPPVIEASPRRWGSRTLGEEQVALTSRWGGYRWGPVRLPGVPVRTLPARTAYSSRAEAPQPQGLVGQHRSSRPGDGTELADIRPFRAGDRIRRVQWRVSLRTGNLHVVDTRGEEDAGVLLVVDALADHGRSAGVDGEASSMDLAVRAAAAIAEHHVRRGDRVALRVLGPGFESVGFGAGQRHLRVLLGRLGGLRVGELPSRRTGELPLGVTGGTVVMVLSPMLSEEVGAATALLVRRGLPVLVVDTLPADVRPAVAEGTDPRLADLAWRMRRLEREQVLARLRADGCPVVAWRGPGTLDEVLHRLARRARQPRVRAR